MHRHTSISFNILLHMSLVVEASPPSPTTKTSTSDHEGASFSPFALPLSPESPPPITNLYNQFTPIKSIDSLLLRSTSHCRSPVARVWSRTAKRPNFGDHKDFPHAPTDCDNEFSTPTKKPTNRILDLEPFAIFDSNSRDSGFDSEASRLSYSLSTGSVGVNSNPGTPSSSASIQSLGHGLCLTPVTNDDPLSAVAKSSHLCLWDDCGDPDLVLEDEDDARRDLLSHVLSRHVQPLELDREKRTEKDQPTLFKCLWRGCKVYGKGSKLYSWLESHVIERHAGPRPFACPLPGCNQRFGSKVSAERHINSHFASDDSPSKEKESCKMAPSNLANKPSPISASTFRRRDKNKSPLSKQQQIASNTRASAKRRILEEECQQPRKRPQEKPLDRLPAKCRRENAIRQSIVNGSKAVKQSLVAEKSSLPKNAIRTRHGGKFRVDIGTSIVRRSRQSESNGDKVKGNVADVRSFNKQLSSNSSSSCQSRISSLSTISKKSASGSSMEIATTKSPNSDVPGTAAASGIVNGGAAKRKTARIRHYPEDAFDAMHSRAMHVLAARYVLSTKKPVDANFGKKNSPSCHKSSGNSPHTDMSSASTVSRQCVCSDYITFHAKVLAKRTCTNGKKVTNDSSPSQCELFCSWTPLGLLPPKWVKEKSFQATISLPRSLFPSLKARESSDDEEEADKLT